MMKSYSVFLPYFKQGDDLSHNMEHTGSDAEALRAHALQLQVAAEILEKLATCAADGNLNIEFADTHCIQVEVEDKTAALLLQEKIIEALEWDEEEEEDDESGV